MLQKRHSGESLTYTPSLLCSICHSPLTCCSLPLPCFGLFGNRCRIVAGALVPKQRAREQQNYLDKRYDAYKRRQTACVCVCVCVLHNKQRSDIIIVCWKYFYALRGRISIQATIYT